MALNIVLVEPEIAVKCWKYCKNLCGNWSKTSYGKAIWL